MTEVLLIVVSLADVPRLLGLVERLCSAGLTIRVALAVPASAAAADVEEQLGGDVAEVRLVRMNLSGRRGGVAPARFSRRWTKVVARNLLVRGGVRVADDERRGWLMVRYDPWIRRRARVADLILAADQDAERAAELAAGHNRDAVRLTATDPALDGVLAQLATTVPLRRVLRQGLARTTAEEVVLAWKRVVADPADPHLGDFAGEAVRVVHALRRGHAFEEAEVVARTAQSLDLPPVDRAALRVELAANQIAAGGYPARELGEAVRELLGFADDALRAGDLEAAGRMAVQATEAVLHRELHADVLTSPLLADPEGFLAPLRESLTFRALRAPAGSMAWVLSGTGSDPRPEPSAGPESSPESSSESPVAPELPASLAPATTLTGPPPRLPGTPAPHRVLVVPGDYPHFTQGIINALADEPDLEVRVLNLREPGVRRRYQRGALVLDRLRDAVGRPVPAPAQPDADLLEWADTIFVDWCDNAAQWVGIHAPRTTRLVVRFHSLEAISSQPHMVDWSQVSEVIFVGRHVRELVERAVPELTRVPGRHVVPNEMRLERFGAPKRAGAERTLAMVGWAQRVKDPLWALEVLARLRASDPTWRLLLIGRDFSPHQHAGALRYQDEFRERAAADDVRDGLVYVGYTTELPDVLRDAGFVLSASRREGFPVGPTEGAASGAVPVVRDWPMYADYAGAGGIFPADWVVRSPEEAADRILAHADPERRAEAGDAARRYVVEHFDWPVVEPTFREVLLGTLDA
ncbi:Glycosyltransferase involved in cell wall bisynthesis [Actinopolymorpha cephalotaxi]|uniref:Glycosyltransferase involved in cell wall biosynthesis n=1 Tax=Actinopolymorpha cephalotaxi TaxID=504797 RepID=A0A1I2ZEJ5_9ACTN|nr:glycosyltransferase family 4 protein [Actinopolymorpha cephalotaxi]NYH81911.1 glycosyltransferase involved in cell wall biosynthesis [Actinopolymorpha cephalotaxi]SFH35541.1 Glycosyltransferase involved in cell wall bisynthesis [Actinopolymorpha cephalotaxi]